MAHDLEITPSGASMAYASFKGTPWHQLGTPLDGLSDVPTILQAAKADYEVNLQPGTMPNPDVPGESLPVEGVFHTFRRRPIELSNEGELTGGDIQVLGTVGSAYKVIQNRQALDLALDLAQQSTDAKVVDTAGVMDDGRRFFAYIPGETLTLDPNGVADKIASGMGIVTGHDGGTSLQIVMSKTRIVCRNTAEAALRSKTKVTIRHTKGAQVSMNEARRILGLRINQNEEFEAIANELLGTFATFGKVESISDRLWKFDKNDTTDRQLASRNRRVAKLHELWTSDTNVGAVGQNGWAAWNTLTEYMDHHTRGDSDTLAARAVMGGMASEKRSAVAQLLSV